MTEVATVKPRGIAPNLWTIIIDAMGFGLIYPIMVILFFDSFFLELGTPQHLREAYLGLSFALYPFCMFFAAPIMGSLSDAIGKKNVMLFCMAGLFISFLLMAFGVIFSNLTLLLIGRAGSGLMAGSQPIAQRAIAGLSREDNRAFHLKLVIAAIGIGIILGPLIGCIFSDYTLSSMFTFSTPFFLAALLALLGFLWLFFGFEEAIEEGKKFDLFKHIRIFIDACRHKSLRFLMFIFFVMQIGFSVYFQLMILLLYRYYHDTGIELGIFNAYIGACFAGAMFLINFFMKFLKAQSIAMYGFLIVAIGEILTSLLHEQIGAWLLAIPTVTIAMLSYTAMLVLFSDVVDKDQQSWAMGIATSIMALSWTITGLATNLIPLIGIEAILFIGGLLLLCSFFLMQPYCRQLKNN